MRKTFKINKLVRDTILQLFKDQNIFYKCKYVSKNEVKYILFDKLLSYLVLLKITI